MKKLANLLTNLVAVMTSVGMASFFLACSATPSYLGSPPQRAESLVKQSPGFAQTVYEPKVDILFIVDHSMSMALHQAKLSQEINNFVDAFSANKQLDFHIAVATIWDAQTDRLQREKGYTLQPPAGELRPLKSSEDTVMEGPRYVTRETPNYLDILRATLKVGEVRIEKGGTEKEESFSPLLNAFKEPLLSSPTNAGFYRPDAHLLVIFITDTDDQTDNITPAQVHKYLVGLKGGDPAKVSYIGVLAHLSEYNVPDNQFRYTSPEAARLHDQCHSPYPRRGDPNGEDYRLPERLRQLIGMGYTYGDETKLLSLCMEYGTQLARLGLQMKKTLLKRDIKIDSFVELGTLKVTYGREDQKPEDRQVIPELKPYDSDDDGWTYNKETRVLSIPGNIKLTPVPGGQLFVTYTPVLRPDPKDVKKK